MLFLRIRPFSKNLIIRKLRDQGRDLWELQKWLCAFHFFIIRIETEGSGNLHFIVMISSFVKAYASIESKMESRF